MLRARPDARRRLDGVAVHPYAADANQALARVAQLRAALAAAGLRRLPIYVTELGWPTSARAPASPSSATPSAHASSPPRSRFSPAPVAAFAPYAAHLDHART